MLDETAPGIDDVTADPAATRAFIKVPTRLIGKLLDHGKVSGVALHLLAVKIWRDGHVLNEKDVRKRYCIGERRFRAAIALLKETGLLQRTQYRRNTWAVEELVTSSGGFVMLPTNLLHERSALVAFVLVANLSPAPQRPVEAAKRIGITSRTTVRGLVKDAVAADAVAHHEGAVARKGYIFGQAKNVVAKNVVAKNVVAKNVATHKRWKRGTTDESLAQEKAFLGHDTRSGERGPNEEVFSGDRAPKRELGAEWIVLTDWKATRYFTDWGVNCDGEVKQWFSHEEWAAAVNHYGGAPGHLTTPAAHRHALEISDLLARTAGNHFDGAHAMNAVAFEVCKAHAAGRRIRSLGFIAERLCRKLADGDFGCVLDLPPRIEKAAFEGAYNLAIEALAAFDRAEPKFPVVRDVMLSTPEIERLARMISEHGRHTVVAAINLVFRENQRPPEGRSAWRWSWFEDNIAAIATPRRTRRR